MTDERQALQQVDQALDSLFSGVSAPPGLRTAVLRRVHNQRLSAVPELLDWVGGVAVLCILVLLIALLIPEASSAVILPIVGCAIAAPSLLFAYWSSYRVS